MKNNQIALWLYPAQLEEITALVRDNINSHLLDEPKDTESSRAVVHQWKNERSGYVETQVGLNGEDFRIYASSMLGELDCQAVLLNKLIREFGDAEVLGDNR